MNGHHCVDTHRHDGIMLLRLARPPAHAFTTELLEDLDAGLAEAEADETVRCVVITGSGDFFSGGFDMKAPPRSPDQAARMADVYHSSHRRLVALPKPTIAAVNGHAVAGGMILALACDHRVAVDRRFRVGLTEVAVGAGYPPAAIAIGVERLGPLASELILAPELRWSDEPRLGAVFRATHPVDSFENEVRQLAGSLAALPGRAFAHTKAEVVRNLVERIDAATPDDRAAALDVWTDPESDMARERLRLALQK